MLGALEKRGLAWGIVTNKPGWLTDPLLIEVKLHRRVRAVVSGDTLSERKPHPMPLLHAAKTIGVEPGECVFVGDAERDAQAAQAAGMFSLIAGFGYIGDDDRADRWFQHGWLNTPLELLDWLDKSGRAPARARNDTARKNGSP
jgi:phosphoglycolate phosphatase